VKCRLVVRHRWVCACWLLFAIVAVSMLTTVL